MPFAPCWCGGERSSSPPQTTFMIYFPTECADPPMFIHIFSLQSNTMGSFMWTWLRLTFYIGKTDLGHKWLKVRQKGNVSFEKYVCLQMLLDIVLACAITFWVNVYKYFEFETTVVQDCMKHVKQGMYIMFNTTKTKVSESLVP